MGGISVVWGEYLTRLSKYVDPEQIILCTPNINNNVLKELDLTSYKQRRVPSRSIISKYFPYLLMGSKRDLLHMGYYGVYPFFRGKKIVTVHDFTYELFGSLLQRLLHNRLKYHCLKQANVILCVSHSTREDLLKIYPQFSKKNIHVTHNAASVDYYPDHGNKVKKLTSPYFLWVGRRDGYKNFNAALHFLKLTKDIDPLFKLAVVGYSFNSKEKREIENLGLTESVANLGNTPLPELRKLYSDAFSLLYLSKYEGFGLPILEAQQCNCPVICENIPSSKEVGNDSVIIVKNYRIEEILKVINDLKNEISRNNLVIKGQKNAKRFDWDKTVKKIVNIYKEILQQT